MSIGREGMPSGFFFSADVVILFDVWMLKHEVYDLFLAFFIVRFGHGALGFNV